MNRRVYGTRMGLSVGLSVAVMLTGCAAIQRSEARSTEQLLAAAGFVMRPADTAERQQHLAALPPYRLEGRTKDGKVVYTYADPGGCQCLRGRVQGVLGISAAARSASDRRGSGVGGPRVRDGLGHMGAVVVI